MEKKDLNKIMIIKLTNFLKGQALLVKDANKSMSTPIERKQEMDVIEDFLNYIKSYENNIQILNKNDQSIDMEI